MTKNEIKNFEFSYEEIEAVHRQQKITAIKLLRERTGFDLKTAKETIDFYYDTPARMKVIGAIPESPNILYKENDRMIKEFRILNLKELAGSQIKNIGSDITTSNKEFKYFDFFVDSEGPFAGFQIENLDTSLDVVNSFLKMFLKCKRELRKHIKTKPKRVIKLPE